MSLPVLVKTWQFILNNRHQAVNSTVDHQYDLYSIKSALINTASFTSAWQVRGSSNSVSASACPAQSTVLPNGFNPAQDLWLSSSNLVANQNNNRTSARSWIVLRQAGINPFFEILIDINEVNNGNSRNFSAVDLIVSPTAGFFGGTTTTAPSASDQLFVKNGLANNGLGSIGNDNWGVPDGTSYTGILNFAMSTDGTITRIWGITNLVNYTYWAFERPGNVDGLWGRPYVATCQGQGTNPGNGVNISTYTVLSDSFNHYTQFTTPTGSFVNPILTACGIIMTQEAQSTTLLGRLLTAPAQLDGSWPIIPMGMYCNAAGVTKRIGTFVDLWGGSTGIPTGDTYPNDGSRQFIQVGNLVQPWNGAVGSPGTAPVLQ